MDYLVWLKDNPISENSRLIMITGNDWYYPQDMTDDRHIYKAMVKTWLIDHDFPASELIFHHSNLMQRSYMWFVVSDHVAALFKLTFD